MSLGKVDVLHKEILQMQFQFQLTAKFRCQVDHVDKNVKVVFSCHQAWSKCLIEDTSVLI